MSFRLTVLLAATVAASAQTPTMKQLMLDLIHPASNQILLLVNRAGPADEAEWAAARHSALTLAESGNLLVSRAPAPHANNAANDWNQDATLLAEAGAAAYKAALAKDPQALAAAADAIDRSCTTCHKQFRPDVFPAGGRLGEKRQEGSK